MTFLRLNHDAPQIVDSCHDFASSGGHRGDGMFSHPTLIRLHVSAQHLVNPQVLIKEVWLAI